MQLQKAAETRAIWHAQEIRRLLENIVNAQLDVAEARTRTITQVHQSTPRDKLRAALYAAHDYLAQHSGLPTNEISVVEAHLRAVDALFITLHLSEKSEDPRSMLELGESALEAVCRFAREKVSQLREQDSRRRVEHRAAQEAAAARQAASVAASREAAAARVRDAGAESAALRRRVN